MAGGYLGYSGGLVNPWEKGFGDYAPDPNFLRSLNQLSANLNPQVQRKRARRGFGQAAGTLSRGTERSLQGLNESLAARGMQNSGMAAAAEGGIRQNEAFGRAGLQDKYRQGLEARQMNARNEYLNFLNNIFGLRTGSRGMSEQIAARKKASPSGFQSVLGDISGVAGALGDLAPFIAAPFTGGASLGMAGIGGGGLSGLMGMFGGGRGQPYSYPPDYRGY